jgi:hypothetical protein
VRQREPPHVDKAEVGTGTRLTSCSIEGTGGADVHGVEMLRLFGERREPERSVTTDVDAPQKNHECHGYVHTVTAAAAYDVFFITMYRNNLLCPPPRTITAAMIISSTDLCRRRFL